MNNGIIEELEQDVRNKFAALKRDTAGFNLRNTSRGLQHFNGIEHTDNT